MRIVGAVIISLAALVISPSSSATEEIHLSKFQRCKEEGTVQIRIAQHVFTVPRKIIGRVVLPNLHYDRSLLCKDVQLEASELQILIRQTYGEDKSFESWTQNLPHVIYIIQHGRIKNFPSQFLLWAQQSGRPAMLNQRGYQVTEYGPELLYDASPLGLFGFENHKVVFQCSKTRNTKSGHTCHTSYPYNDAIDISYRFDDGRISQDGWVNLDARVRQFLEHMTVRN